MVLDHKEDLGVFCSSFLPYCFKAIMLLLS